MRQLKNGIRRARRIFRACRGRDFYVGVQVHCATVVLGNELAEWCVCPDVLSRRSVVYSFGVGDDISFDLELIRRYGMKVHAFDPTPRAITWVRSQKLPEEFIFHDYGIGAVDGNVAFRPPESQHHVSYSAISRNFSAAASVEAPVRRLSTIMKMLRHERVDLLKMDIEGAEYDVLQEIVASEVRVEQLLVEFHHRWEDVGPQKTREIVHSLNDQGFQIFNVSATGEEYSFIKM